MCYEVMPPTGILAYLYNIKTMFRRRLVVERTRTDWRCRSSQQNRIHLFVKLLIYYYFSFLHAVP